MRDNGGYIKCISVYIKRKYKNKLHCEYYPILMNFPNNWSADTTLFEI